MLSKANDASFLKSTLVYVRVFICAFIFKIYFSICSRIYVYLFLKSTLVYIRLFMCICF